MQAAASLRNSLEAATRPSLRSEFAMYQQVLFHDRKKFSNKKNIYMSYAYRKVRGFSSSIARHVSDSDVCKVLSPWPSPINPWAKQMYVQVNYSISYPSSWMSRCTCGISACVSKLKKMRRPGAFQRIKIYLIPTCAISSAPQDALSLAPRQYRLGQASGWCPRPHTSHLVIPTPQRWKEQGETMTKLPSWVMVIADPFFGRCPVWNRLLRHLVSSHRGTLNDLQVLVHEQEPVGRETAPRNPEDEVCPHSTPKTSRTDIVL